MWRFFWAPKTYAKIMGKKIFTILRRIFLFIKTCDTVKKEHVQQEEQITTWGYQFGIIHLWTSLFSTYIK